MRKILVVEDDVSTMNLIQMILEKNGYEVIPAFSGQEADQYIKEKSFEAVLLDMVLPDSTGLQLLQSIRKTPTYKHVPIIIVTSKNEEIDVVLGLEMGADDYIHKPFNKRELLARLNVIFRRMEFDESRMDHAIRFGDIEVNPLTHVVLREGQVVSLSPKEFKLLHFLISNPNIIFTRDQLLNKVWDDEVAYETRTVDVHIRKIREKVEENPKKPIWIETIRGFGYRFSK